MGLPLTEVSGSAKCIVLSVFIISSILSVNGAVQEIGDCDFDTKVDKNSPTWVIVGEKEVPETAHPTTVIWNVSTENIVGSISSSHAHTKYLSGYRYSSSYVYKASENFPNFVDKEEATKITRRVTFDCKNNYQVTVDFQFPLEDVNDPPEFIKVPSNELAAKLGSSDDINEYPIVVWDKDFNSDFNELEITTDRPEVLQISVSSVEEGKNGIGKKYSINLKLKPGVSISEGRYNLNLFAYDGQYTVSANIIVVVSKPEIPPAK